MRKMGFCVEPVFSSAPPDVVGPGTSPAISVHSGEHGVIDLGMYASTNECALPAAPGLLGS